MVMLTEAAAVLSHSHLLKHVEKEITW